MKYKIFPNYKRIAKLILLLGVLAAYQQHP